MKLFVCGQEEWKDIPGCEGTYQVSNTGKVRSLERWVVGGKGKQQHVPERLLKHVVDTDGYHVVSIKFNNNSRRLMKVHRLVLLAFVGPSDLVCCHADRDRKNNLLSNLRYGTPQDNVDDRTMHGQIVGALGEQNGVAKLTETDVRSIREYLAATLSHAKIAKLFGVATETVRKIAIGITWKHI